LIQVVLAEEVDLRAKFGEAIGAVGGLARAEVITKAEEDEGEDDREDRGNCATWEHDHSKFGS
jgi:hypothetical protein